jgi:hypothetical protein
MRSIEALMQAVDKCGGGLPRALMRAAPNRYSDDVSDAGMLWAVIRGNCSSIGLACSSSHTAGKDRPRFRY